MVGVDSGSLYRRTHSLSRLAWSWVDGRLTPFYITRVMLWFYIHQMNRVNSRNDSAMMTKHCLGIIIIITTRIMIINIANISTILAGSSISPNVFYRPISK